MDIESRTLFDYGFGGRGTKRPREQENQENQTIEEIFETIKGKIYKWTFIPPDSLNHWLSGISYIGQTMQSLDKRTTQHKIAAKRDGKDYGLHALYILFPNFWKIEIVDERQFTGPQPEARAAASTWMNDRERALIKEHGGKLKNMDAKLKQTLNLTDGGQAGDPKKNWQKMQAKTRAQWKKYSPLFDAFFHKHGHVNVPQKDTELGSVVPQIRSRNSFVTTCPEIRTYLEKRNFIWNVDEEHGNIIKEILLSYDNPNKARTYVEKLDPESDWAKRWKMVRHESEKEDEINIGSIIHSIRSAKQFVNDPIFRAQLLKNGFVMNVDEERRNISKEILLSYDNPNKAQTYVEKLDPESDWAKRWKMVRYESEKDNEIKIGTIINNIRQRGDLIDSDPDFFETLIAKEFKMHTQDAKKNQERIEEKRELHRQKEKALVGREDKLILTKWTT